MAGRWSEASGGRGNASVQAPQGVGDRADQEVYALVLSFLEDSPCVAACEALKREANAYGLLPPRLDFKGQLHHDKLPEKLPDRHLKALLDQLKKLSKAAEPRSTRISAAPDTLLTIGPLALAPNYQEAPTEKLQKALLWSAEYRAKLNRFGEAKRSVGARLGRTSKRGNDALLHLTASVLSRQVGANALLGRRCMPRFLLRDKPPRAMATSQDSKRGLSTTKSIRGHILPAFCMLIDASGTRIITGADDSNVKVWSASSGMLQRTLRGHVQEVRIFPTPIHMLITQ